MWKPNDYKCIEVFTKLLKFCKLQLCWFMRWLNEDCISMKTEIKSTLWHASQVLENQSRNFLLCSHYQISLSMKSFILFSKLISVCDSAIRGKKTSTIVSCILIPFVTNITIYKKNPSKPKIWRLSYCLIVIYKITQ